MDAFLDRDDAGERIVLDLTVGSDEEVLSSWDLLAGGDLAIRERWVKSNRMVGNARSLAAPIAARERDGLVFRFGVPEGFDHSTSRAVAASAPPDPR